MHVHYFDGTIIDLGLQLKMRAAYKEVTDIKRPFIFTGGEFVSVTKEARENAVAMENQIPISATAIVIQNLAQKIIADYYYKINKPKKPLKIFKNIDKGIEWLKDFQQIE